MRQTLALHEHFIKGNNKETNEWSNHIKRKWRSNYWNKHQIFETIFISFKAFCNSFNQKSYLWNIVLKHYHKCYILRKTINKYRKFCGTVIVQIKCIFLIRMPMHKCIKGTNDSQLIQIFYSNGPMFFPIFLKIGAFKLIIVSML